MSVLLIQLVLLAVIAVLVDLLVRDLAALFRASDDPQPENPEPPEGTAVPLGRWRDPWDYCLGVVISAVKGAGKTSLLKRMVNHIFDLDDGGDPVWIIDTGDRWAEHLAAVLPPGVPVRRISVQTVGGLGVDFAKFLTSPARVLQFVKKVIPENQDKNPFFPSNAQLVVKAAIDLLNLMAPGRWTLRDVIVLSCNRKLFLCLRNQPAYRRRVADPLSPYAHNDSSRDVTATVISHLMPLAVFAALNERTPAKVSPLDGLADGGVTVLEWSDEFAPSLERVYALFVDLLAEHRLSRPFGGRRIWLLLDELASLAPLDCVPKLGMRARRSGVCFVFSVHTVAALWDRYGKDRANNILGLMGIKLFLKTSDDPDTLRWAADCVGKCDHVVEVWQDGRGETPGYWSRSLQEKHLVDPETLKRLPLPKDGRVGGYVVDDAGPRPFETDYAADCPRPVGDGPPEAPAEWQFLLPFTKDDIVRLNGTLPPDVDDALEDQL